mgnify:CR=1 FL=1
MPVPAFVGISLGTSRDDLVECAALIRAWQAGELDRIVIPLDAQADARMAARLRHAGAAAGDELVVMHVSERSVLPAILAREGPLPASHAQDGEKLRPGRVNRSRPAAP